MLEPGPSGARVAFDVDGGGELGAEGGQQTIAPGAPMRRLRRLGAAEVRAWHLATVATADAQYAAALKWLDEEEHEQQKDLVKVTALTIVQSERLLKVVGLKGKDQTEEDLEELRLKLIADLDEAAEAQGAER